MAIEKEVKIEWEGRQEVVVLQELKYGDYLKFVKETSVAKLGPEITTEVDMEKYGIQALLKSIKKAPFPVNEESIRNLPKSLGMQLLAAFNEMLAVTPEKK
jgi:hypothetical protein